MTLIDADKFLAYLIYSKHIDGLTCGEVKEAIEMCKVDVLDRIRAEIEELDGKYVIGDYATYGEHSPKYVQVMEVLQVIDKYRNEVNE